MSDLTSPLWWRAAGQRAAYTAIAAAVPLATLLVDGSITPWYMLSFVATAALLSLLNTFGSLPEASEGQTPLHKAILGRVLRTVGQTAIPALAGVTLLGEIDWSGLGVAVGGAALVTLLRTLLAHLPESPV